MPIDRRGGRQDAVLEMQRERTLRCRVADEEGWRASYFDCLNCAWPGRTPFCGYDSRCPRQAEGRYVACLTCSHQWSRKGNVTVCRRPGVDVSCTDIIGVNCQDSCKSASSPNSAPMSYVFGGLICTGRSQTHINLLVQATERSNFHGLYSVQGES